MPPCHRAGEASDCRALAHEFQGRPEGRLLLRLAVETDWPLGLADEAGTSRCDLEVDGEAERSAEVGSRIGDVAWLAPEEQVGAEPATAQDR